MNTYDILEEISVERERQDGLWGQQDHESSYSDLTVQSAAKNARHWKQANAQRVTEDRITWDGILLEEVWEALAEKDDLARREELIQVAAVAVAEIEAIDRRLNAEAERVSVRLCDFTGEPCDQGCEVGCLILETEED